MSRVRPLVRTVAGFALALCAWGSIPVPIAPEQPLVLSFSLAKRAVTLHEPVLLLLSVENRSGETARLDLGFNRVGNLQFLITDPRRTSIRLAPHPPEGLARYGVVAIAPGKRYAQDILLSGLYGFATTGQYSIQASLVPGGARPTGVQSQAYQSDPMSLHVLPRDPSQLRIVCGRLVDKIKSADPESAIGSAKALSYVNDLVAVPYLERAATQGPYKVAVREIAIHGLARISVTWGEDKVFARLPRRDAEVESEISAAMVVIRGREVRPRQ